MIEFAFLKWPRLIEILSSVAATPEYLLASTVPIAVWWWLFRPLCRRYRIKIPVTIDGKKRKIRPGVQRYRRGELYKYNEEARQDGKTACITGSCVILSYFTIASSLMACQQGIIPHGFPSTLQLVLFVLVLGVFWLVTPKLWELTPRWIEPKQEKWDKRRKMGCLYYEDQDGWKGWTGWELEDEELLTQRIGAPSTSNNDTAWKMLKKNPLEMSFWKMLMEMREPHIYQLMIPTPAGDKDYRYLDFTLLNPKTGEPVLGIETDESHHFTEPAPQWDFERELEIMAAVGIPIHRIPSAYWFRGLAPGDMKYPDKIKENQKRLLGVALRERDRIIKEKQARWRWLPRPLRRQ